MKCVDEKEVESKGMGRSQRWLRIEPPNAKLRASADIVNLFCAVQLNYLINKV